MISNKGNHVGNLRKVLMDALADYIQENDDAINDVVVLAALGATFCEALIIKQHPFDEDIIDVLKSTYAICKAESEFVNENEKAD